MKIRGELLSATRRSEFENLKKVGENVRAASETEEYRNMRRCIDIFRASFGTQRSHSTKFVFSKKYIIKQLLDEVFVICGIINVEVRVMHLKNYSV